MLPPALSAAPPADDQRVDAVVDEHADRQTAVVARPEPRQDLDPVAAAAVQADEPGLLRLHEDLADMGARHAEALADIARRAPPRAGRRAAIAAWSSEADTMWPAAWLKNSIRSGIMASSLPRERQEGDGRAPLRHLIGGVLAHDRRIVVETADHRVSGA